MNFTQMVTLFASKMAGGSDDDDVILQSFEAFEINGQIDAEAFRHSLMTFGNKFSASEVGCFDHAAVDLEFSEGIVDLTGGEFVAKGHEGMSESLSVNLSIDFKSLK